MILFHDKKNLTAYFEKRNKLKQQVPHEVIKN